MSNTPRTDAVFCSVDDPVRRAYALRNLCEKMEHELARLKRKRMTRRQVMAVLSRVFDEGGYKVTVRAYNSILTGLGYRLGKY